MQRHAIDEGLLGDAEDLEAVFVAYASDGAVTGPEIIDLRRRLRGNVIAHSRYHQHRQIVRRLDRCGGESSVLRLIVERERSMAARGELEAFDTAA